LLDDAQPGQVIRAIPGAGSKVPVWMLGSSFYGAQLAAALGLPYAFASHFAPQELERAAALYRAQYQPSPRNPRPCLMLGLNVSAAETDAEARRLFTSLQQAFINLRSGQPGPLPPPVDDIAPYRADPRIGMLLDSALSAAVVGSPEAVKRGVEDFIARHQPDELMVTAQIYDHAARKRSFEILKGLFV
jgi:luciferase family oxidoreductase group 1